MRKALGLAILSAGLALPVVVAQTQNKSAQPAATIAPASPIANTSSSVTAAAVVNAAAATPATSPRRRPWRALR